MQFKHLTLHSRNLPNPSSASENWLCLHSDTTASLFYTVYLGVWIDFSVHLSLVPTVYVFLFWLLWMENMWATTSSPEKAAFSPSCRTRLPLPTSTINLTFVHLQESASTRMTEKVVCDGLKTGLESESCDPEPLSQKGPTPQTRQGCSGYIAAAQHPTLLWLDGPVQICKAK